MIASIIAHISGQFQMMQIIVVESATKALYILEQRLAKKALKITSPTNIKFGRQANKLAVQFKSLGSSSSECDELEMRKKRLMYYFTEEDFNLAMIDCV